MSTVTAPKGSPSRAAGYTFAYVRSSDPLAKPLLDDLEREYDSRYGVEVFGEPASVEINRYPESSFAEPDGAFLLLLRDGVPVSGGAFFRYDETTAEFKRVWTRSDLRGRGLARLVLTELEHEAKRLGYQRVYLTTGPRQPEAVALYTGHGYTRLFDASKPPEEVGAHPFEKSLADHPVRPRGVVVEVPGTASAAPAKESEAPTTGSGDAPPRGAGGTSAPVPSAHEPSAVRRVVPLRHWWRWIISAIVVFLLAQLVWTFFTNPQWRWPVFAEYFFNDAVLRGLWLTLWMTAVSSVIGFVLGSLLAVARLSGSPLLNSFAWGFIWFFRSVPLIVQLVLWYNLGYLFPTLGIGWPFTYDFWVAEFDTVQLISAVAAAILGLSLHQAAYSAEIIRGGLLSVDQGQLEAAKALGIPRARRFFRITLPQAARAILPNAFNEIISLLKGTSVLFIIALPELFYTVQVIYNRNAQVVPLLLVATVWYTIFTSVLSVIQFYIERHFARGATRELPPTPIQRARRWLRDLPARFRAGRDEVPASVQAAIAAEVK
ncbi:ABC transporter permease subunit [Leucobacter weissii]|uniref:ABC transporter permease subunit n=1 Tax=Leucobacter weissii TaxID=1983706 RepID=A0A939MMK5_9MICO|nr:ABC transporter permease subunit [Leucobacter weissii]